MSHWWENHPWRMLQTNLREQDMEDMDARRFVQDLQEFGSTVVMVSAAGIVANYATAIPNHMQSAYLHGDLQVCPGQRQRMVDNASVDFIGFRYRDSSVSPALTELRLWQSLANGGGLSYYIMGRLDNHRDISGYDGVKKVFAFHRQNEAFYSGLRSAAPVLVVEKSGMSREDPEVYGWIHGLTQSHIPFDTCKLQELTERSLDGKTAVLLGDVKALNADQAGLLDSFAENGGTVAATGDTGIAPGSGAMALKCLGVTAVGACQKGLMSTALEVTEEDRAVFARCGDAPIIPVGDVFRPVVFTPEAKTYLRVIPEHPYGPPERCYPVPTSDQPGIAVHPYGEGKGIYIPALLGSLYYREGWQNTLNIMQDILFGLCGLPGLAGGRARTLCGGQVSCRDENGGLEIRLDVLNAYEAVAVEPEGKVSHG